MTTPLIKTEHAAGGCVYKLIASQPVWLIGQHSGYHKWVLPKGLIEPGESSLEAALREVAEEMGVKAKIVTSKPIHIEKYHYTADLGIVSPAASAPIRRVKVYQESGGHQITIQKTVDFYLMEWVSGHPAAHDWEMSHADWFPLNEALQKLAFPGERLALQQSHDRISPLLINR